MLVSREGSIFRWAPLIDRCTVVVSIHRCNVYLPVNCIPVVGQHLLGHAEHTAPEVARGTTWAMTQKRE